MSFSKTRFPNGPYFLPKGPFFKEAIGPNNTVEYNDLRLVLSFCHFGKSRREIGCNFIKSLIKKGQILISAIEAPKNQTLQKGEKVVAKSGLYVHEGNLWVETTKGAFSIEFFKVEKTLTSEFEIKPHHIMKKAVLHSYESFLPPLQNPQHKELKTSG